LDSNSALLSIKRGLESHVGQKIRVRANKGRRKIVEKEGILEKTYPSIFIVRLDEDRAGERRVSYSYTDVLTETVELVISGSTGDLKISAASH
jgi:uncharacterized protein Veg